MPRKGACVSASETIAGALCGLEFLGVDKTVFASDAPFDHQGGDMFIRQSIKIIDSLDISGKDSKKVYHDNAVALMKPTGI